MSDIVWGGETPLCIQVQSQAKPEAELLLEVRSIVQQHPDLQSYFLRLRSENKSPQWLQDLVSLGVSVLLSDKYTFEQVSEACLYLADEYLQLGEGYFLVSTETGRVEAVLRQEDLYSPGLLPREGGGQGQALLRIRPDLEASIVIFNHEKAREETIRANLIAKLHHQTALLKEDGDNRLRIATRSGRTAIAKDLAGDDAHELLSRSGGTTGMFMRHFELAEERTMTPDQEVIEGVAVFRSTMDVQDALTANLSYNRLGTLKGAAPQGWVRDIARALSQRVHDIVRPVEMPLEVVHAGALKADMWIAEPDAVPFFREHLQIVAPVDAALPLGLKDHVGVLVVPRDFQVETREEFGKWDIVASLPYKLFFRLHHTKPLNLLGIAHASTIEH